MATYNLKIDDAGGGVFYAGQALPGSTTSEAVWQIQRITLTSGDWDAIFADGDILFDNVWDDRTSLTYSE